MLALIVALMYVFILLNERFILYDVSLPLFKVTLFLFVIIQSYSLSRYNIIFYILPKKYEFVQHYLLSFTENEKIIFSLDARLLKPSHSCRKS